ncbi:MAG TPA: peptidoglycan DD-metalloendopeptidase family protein [Actinomycetota bacterium]|nr:peptidoglycan DD-metalloendopeptidase family protein [Actinomycetota bacterium]
MADNSTRARRTSLRRALGVVLATALVAGLASVAVAAPSTKEKYDAAKAELAQLRRDIERQQDFLSALNAEAAVIAERYEVALGRWEQITLELRNTQNELHDAQDAFRALQGELDDRAREAYIVGPGNELEFLLGASSFTDLSARVEFVNALSQVDVDLATEVQNVKNELSVQRREQMRLQGDAADALAKVEGLQAEVEAKLAEAQGILADLNAKEARAEELAKKLGRQWQRELAALTGLKFYANELLKVCPVGQPRALYDGFGAPRYGGGYHPHAGNDIISPQGTELYAVFDGYARASYNGLGGNSVHVYGPLGYAYYAHLVQPGYTGPVQAGQVVGYVGSTGSSSTPHLHFEWHPNTTPSSWPASPYGYSIITGYTQPAVNPYPLLAPVCG